MLSRENYIKRVPASTFRAQKRGGKGIIGGTTKEEDEIKTITYTFNHDNILFFTNKGRVYELPTYEIPIGSRISKGQAIVNLLQLGENENITAILNTGDKFLGEFLFMATKNGTIKKTPVEDFRNMRKSGLIAIKLRENDSLEWVKEVSKNDEIVLVTKEGKCIRFKEEEARPLGRPSIGVRGIRVKSNDCVVEMAAIKDPETSELLVVTANGLGKTTKIGDYRLQSRGGSGVKTANVTTKTGKIIGAKIIGKDMDADLVIMSKVGQVIRLNTKNIPSLGRATQGVYLMRLHKDDHVASVSLMDNIETKVSQGEQAFGTGETPLEKEDAQSQLIENQDQAEDIEETEVLEEEKELVEVGPAKKTKPSPKAKKEKTQEKTSLTKKVIKKAKK